MNASFYKKIQTEISVIEEKHDIRILYAIESGSRAWGFPSINSDWDVRYIYVYRNHSAYLQIEDLPENIEYMLPDDIDIVGWDLRKALRLLRKSNPSLIEWLQSDIIYRTTVGFHTDMMIGLNHYLNLQALSLHYYHLATNTYNKYLIQNEVRTKKYFYALRPILACQWILRHGTIPPIQFSLLLESAQLESKLKEEIIHLLERKKIGYELGVENRNPCIHEYIDEQIISLKAQLMHIPSSGACNDASYLNQIFQKYIL